MKKFITLLAAAALSVSLLSAQNASRSTGDMSIVAGAGFGSLGPCLSASFDYTAFDFGQSGNLSFGGYAGDSVEDSTHCLLVGALANYRFPVSSAFELSARGVVGYAWVFNQIAHTRGIFGKAVMAGANYYFSDRIGVGAELGLGVAPALSAHVVIRL
ncbi:MAG: hypothetical protein IJQ93_04370 [Bacteroidales bacterium]|nr:hypothetical protein [Bacteroidales bacterium]